MDSTRSMLEEMVSVYVDGEKIGFKYNPDGALEYLKWLTYVPEFEFNEMNSLLNKDIWKLTSDEVDKIKVIKQRQEMISTFKRYLSDDCTKEDVLIVYDYMKENNIEDLMLSKLTYEQYMNAKKLISNYLSINNCDLTIEKTNEENATTLEMLKSYIEYHLDKFSKKNSNEIYIRISEKDEEKSQELYYAINPKRK